mgnify:CR=1 FL=1
MNKVKLVVKVMIIGLICMVGSFVNANPNTNPYYESVEELLLIMKIDENLSNSLAQIRPMILQQFQQATPEEMTPEQVQVMEKFIGRLLDLMEEEMRWEKIKDDYIQVYMSIYTEEEIQELIKFYRTPVGQKTIDQMPILVEKSMEISQKYLMATLPKIQALTEEMQAEIEATIKE